MRRNGGVVERLGLRLPLLQAPMAGVSTPELAAAVTEAGGLGALGLGAMTPDAAAKSLARARALTAGPINANVFCHAPAPPDPVRHAAWLARLRPLFLRFGAEPPESLPEIYRSFTDSPGMLEALLEARPAVVSFHFGLPDPESLARLRKAGCMLIATATCLAEARRIVAAGLDAVIAQGWEAGGHRGIFDPAAPDDRPGTLGLVRALASACDVPVIAAGGIMDGAGIAAAEQAGAAAAQLGTAFIGCPESAADESYRAALRSEAAGSTVMTRVFSGRPARALDNAMTRWAGDVPEDAIPAYPYAYAAGKALAAAAASQGEPGYAAHWAGQGAPRARALPAPALVARLAEERAAALAPET
ncbi:MAG: NAD(P)H-dependent flavin oxidoreductase [Paracoccaceae bacterium]